MSETFTIKGVRFSFVNVWTPRAANEGAQEKYSTTILIPKDNKEAMGLINAHITEAFNEGVEAGKFGQTAPTNPKTPLYDGDGTRPGGEPFGEECKGHYVITAGSLQKPEVVDANLQPIINQSDFYSGCYGNVSMRFFAYNKAGSKGIGCGLGNIQKTKDGDPLSGRTSAKDDFTTEAPVGAVGVAGTGKVNPITGQPL